MEAPLRGLAASPFQVKGFSLCFRTQQMLIGLLRSRHGYWTVPSAMCRSFWTWGSRFRVLPGKLEGRYSDHAGGGSELGLNYWLPGLPGSAALSDDAAVVGRFGGACRCRKGCSKAVAVRRRSVPAELEFVEIAAHDGHGAGHGRCRAPQNFGFENTRWIHCQHEMGGRCHRRP